MMFLISQMLFCLLVAALLGFLVGLWWCRARCRRRHDEMEAAWRERLNRSEADLTRCRRELEKGRSVLQGALGGGAIDRDEPQEVAPVPLVTTALPRISEVEHDPAADDLKKIEGIGPKIEGLLNSADISRWAELAETPVVRLQEILKSAGERYRIHDPTTWPDQAELAAQGRWEELRQYQDLFQGGRA